MTAIPDDQQDFPSASNETSCVSVQIAIVPQIRIRFAINRAPNPDPLCYVCMPRKKAEHGNLLHQSRNVVEVGRISDHIAVRVVGLDGGWVEHLEIRSVPCFTEKYPRTHDSARSTEHSGGKVDSELRLDDTRVSVWSRNSAGRGQRGASDMETTKVTYPQITRTLDPLISLLAL